MLKIAKIFIPLMILVVASGAAWLLMVSSPKAMVRSVPSQPPLVSTIQVYPQDVSVPIFTQGTVKPRTQIELSAEVSGRVVETATSFAEGAFFKKGDVMLRINTRDYRLAVTKAEAQVARAKQQLAQAKAEYKQKQKEYYGVSPATVSDFALRKPKYDEAMAELRAAEAELELAEIKLTRCEILAPFDGRVLSRHADVGQYVTPGKVLATIYAVDIAEIRLPLSQFQAELLDLPLDIGGESSGIAVILRGQYAGKMHTWEGKIVRTDASIDDRNRMLYVIAQVADPYGMHTIGDVQPPLAMGMFAEAEIQSRLMSGLYELPPSVVHNENTVWLLDDNSKLQVQKVQVVYRGKNNAYVTGNLKPGDTVVTSPLDVMVDGMELRAVMEKVELEQSR
jgi:RND family efflux transporter MFP subunit